MCNDSLPFRRTLKFKIDQNNFTLIKLSKSSFKCIQKNQRSFKMSQNYVS